MPMRIAVACLCLFAAYAVRAADPDADYFVYVSNEVSNELSIIDPRVDEVVATIDVGRRPRGVRVSSDGRYVFVALSGSPRCPPTMADEECERLVADKSADGIAIVDVASLSLLRVLPGGSDPEQFDLSPDDTRLYVANEDADVATIVDVATGVVVKTLSVGREPEGVKVSPDGEVFLVTSETDHNVSVIDAETGDIVARIDVGLRPRDIAFGRDGRRAFVSAEIGRHVAVIDTTSWTLLDTIPISDTALPMGLAVADDADSLFVANGRDRTVAKVDLATRTVVASTEVGTRPWGVALSPDGRQLYTANGPSNDVTVVDTATMSVTTTISVGQSPWGVAIGSRP